MFNVDKQELKEEWQYIMLDITCIKVCYILNILLQRLERIQN